MIETRIYFDGDEPIRFATERGRDEPGAALIEIGPVSLVMPFAEAARLRVALIADLDGHRIRYEGGGE